MPYLGKIARLHEIPRLEQNPFLVPSTTVAFDHSSLRWLEINI
jgi:hypothetical protein